MRRKAGSDRSHLDAEQGFFREYHNAQSEASCSPQTSAINRRQLMSSPV